MTGRRWVAAASALGLTVVGFGVSSTPAAGAGPNVLLVAPQAPAGGFSSIQDAVNAANPGDWILVAPGVYHEKGFNPVNGPSKPPPAEVYITKPNLHIRGMNRDTVIVDGTNISTTQAGGALPAGSPACSSDPALQDPGLLENDGNRHTREGILVWKTAGVSIENLTSCNSMSNEIWWDNGDGSGVQTPMALNGDYLTATSTFYKDANNRSAQYGIFTSNVLGPGEIDHSYANNMTDSSYYIGACRNCNLVLNHPHAENSALGLSTTNAGGNLLIENGEWDLNRTGLVSNAQNNDDYPSPQYGQCVAPSTPPPGAGPNSCDLWTGNYIHDNNNPNTPGSGLTSVSAVGAGVELAATQHISVVDNRIENNGAWGVVTHDFPDPENGPANCNGGVPIPNGGSSGQFVCYWYSRGNTVANNSNLHNGFLGNPTNGDDANQASGSAWAPTDTYGGAPDPNCYHGNTNPDGDWPTTLQTAPCPPGTSESAALTAQLVCATGAASLFAMGLANPPACPSGSNYPQHDGKCTAPAVLTPAGDTTNGMCFLPLSYTLSPAVTPTMPGDPCAGVPANPFCATIPSVLGAVSTSQYTLPNSDGSTWQEIDSAKLRISTSPAKDQSTLLTANADLWTANAGYNQDLGVFVSDNGGADTLLGWKESGGFAGTYSPNALFLQYPYAMTAGHVYVFKLKWKTNKNAPGTTIWAGAGAPGNFSPTSLMAETFPSGAAPNFVATNSQYTLTNSDGATWQAIDASGLTTTLSPTAGGTAVLGANADLWTSQAGYNQDLGIFVSDNGGPDTLVAWKESGGSAGTYSPNAAFVKATYPMTAGHSYAFKLKWKTNKNAPGATIWSAAGGPGNFSPTSLFAQYIPTGAGPYSSVSTSQYALANSDGATWQPVDSSLDLSVGPSANTNSLVTANADLFTGNAGFNQDIGIFVSDNGGADTLVAWKESGGFAGTFSPNAAFSQATYPMTAGHAYVFKLKWKTNIAAPGSTIYAGAASGLPFSPTRLCVELTG